MAWHRVPPAFAAAGGQPGVSRDGRRATKPLYLWGAIAGGVLCLSMPLTAYRASAQRAPAALQIFVRSVEVRGSMTTEKLVPPATNPMDLSKGRASRPRVRWIRVRSSTGRSPASFVFTPAFATIQQGHREVDGVRGQWGPA